jgi:hypothetical protein
MVFIYNVFTSIDHLARHFKTEPIYCSVLGSPKKHRAFQPIDTVSSVNWLDEEGTDAFRKFFTLTFPTAQTVTVLTMNAISTHHRPAT